MKQISKYLLPMLAVIFLHGCSKEAGFGGNSAITGSLRLKVYNADFSELLDDVDLADTYVYLSTTTGYGYLDRVNTSFNGSFEFNNLNPGDYIIYTYSSDTTLSSIDDIVIQKTVTINSSNESVSCGTLTVATSVTVGNSSISGRIMYQSVSNPNFQYPAPDERVFIMYNDEPTYKTFVRTSYDGYYIFDRLPIGKYRIYAYSADIDNISPYASIPVLDSLVIEHNGTDTTLSDIVIYN
ncbi:MAG: hypothetical protein K9J06_05070 [Flavobacteriales bacterium]|nr:hypothetical protein [Flavobacteriales bacterium]